MNKPIHRLVFLVVALSLLASMPAAAAPAYKVIVHGSSRLTGVSRSTLQAVFLKKTSKWDDGTAATAVDLVEKSRTRQEFSREVLARDVSAVKSYWLNMVFSGRETPPVEVPTDAKMIELVARTPGSIGYVAAETALPDGVKVIEVTK